MQEKKVVQTAIRLDASLLERLKAKSKAENRSLNRFIVNALEKALEPRFPQLKRAELAPAPDLETLGSVLDSVVAVKKGGRAAYILSKYAE